MHYKVDSSVDRCDDDIMFERAVCCSVNDDKITINDSFKDHTIAFYLEQKRCGRVRN